MADYTIKLHDTLPPMEATLKDNTGAAYNLTGAAVQIHLRCRNTGTVVNKAATITDAPNGVVSYTLATNDISAAGSYDVEWQVTFSGGAVLTFPNTGFLELSVLPDLA
ncbi:MAG: BppU family phage baseplate upper protein [Ignavibacteria bacterium]|jgi:hypothetical protein|nr:BppU family phage baseplate upper protein [Ignavibacteria bacterium]